MGRGLEEAFFRHYRVVNRLLVGIGKNEYKLFLSTFDLQILAQLLLFFKYSSTETTIVL